MSDDANACKHARIQTWRFEDTGEVSGLWSCSDCGRKFEPVAAAQPTEPAFTAPMVEAIYAAWHGAGVDIAGGNWARFVGMLPRA